MILWKCDRCGLEQRGEQIVGHEFDYSKRFSSLVAPVDGMRDLCNDCMKIANDAALAFTRSQGEGKLAAVARALKSYVG